MPHYITTHNAEGKAVFSTAVPTAAHVNEGPSFSMQFIWTSHEPRPDLSTDADVTRYGRDRETGLTPGTIVPPRGFASAIVTIQPSATAVFHRTPTLDTLVVLEGDIELHLDSGEVRTVHPGDTVVQRGTCHAWRNVTPHGGLARMFGSSIPAAPLEVGGKALKPEWQAPVEWKEASNL